RFAGLLSILVALWKRTGAGDQTDLPNDRLCRTAWRAVRGHALRRSLNESEHGFLRQIRTQRRTTVAGIRSPKNSRGGKTRGRFGCAHGTSEGLFETSD